MSMALEIFFLMLFLSIPIAVELSTCVGVVGLG